MTPRHSKGNKPDTSNPFENPVLGAVKLNPEEIETIVSELAYQEVRDVAEPGKEYFLIMVDKDRLGTKAAQERFASALRACFAQHGMTLNRSGGDKNFFVDTDGYATMEFHVPPELMKRRDTDGSPVYHRDAKEKLEDCLYAVNDAAIRLRDKASPRKG